MKQMKTVLVNCIVIATVGLFCGCNLAPLKGGRATTSGVIGQTVVQDDNPAQPSRQDQETVKTRSYTVPAGSRLEETHYPGPEPLEPIAVAIHSHRTQRRHRLSTQRCRLPAMDLDHRLALARLAITLNLKGKIII
jgi:hypothetical protein